MSSGGLPVSYEPRFMKRALELAASADAAVQPNPYVGAVAVREGRIVGEGFHSRFGEAHAEVKALDIDERLAEGCDLYVTLEPCSHHGKTPPCTDLIIKKKVRAVYAAMEDPNPLVAGEGFRKLKKAGVEVRVGFQEKKARELNRIFIKNILQKRPYIILKYAMTADGYIATCTGDSKWISCEESREVVHRLRHNVKGIMVGAGTVLRDNPRLSARLNPRGWQPVKVIYDPLGEISSPEFHVFEGKGVILTQQEKYLDIKGFRNYTLPGGSALSGREFTEVLWKEGLYSLLVEGGAHTIHTLLEAGLVDEVVVFIAPRILGGGLSPAGGRGVPKMEMARPLKDPVWRKVGEDIMLKGKCHDVYGPH